MHSKVKTFAPLFFLMFIDNLGLGILFPILIPVFMLDNGILDAGTSMDVRNILYGLTLAVFPLGMFFGATILGDMSDRMGRKMVLLICLLGAFIGYSLSGFALDIGNISLLVASRLLAGLTAGSQPIAQAAVIDLSPLERRAQYIGFMIIPAALGFVAGPLLGAWLSDATVNSHLSLSTPLYCAAVLSLINAIMLCFSFKETYRQGGKLHIKISKSFDLFIFAFRDKTIRLLSIIYLLFQLGWSIYFQFISLFLLEKYAFDSYQIGYFIALLGFGCAVGSSVVLKMFLNYFTIPSIVLTNLLIMAVITLSTVIIDSAIWAWISAVPLALSLGIVFSGVITLYSNRVDEHSQGWVMGVTGSVLAAAWFPTGIIAGLLQSMSIDAPLITASALMFMSVGIMIFQYGKVSGGRISEDAVAS